MEDRFQRLRFWILRETFDSAIPSNVRGRVFRPSQNMVPNSVRHQVPDEGLESFERRVTRSCGRSWGTLLISL